MIFLYFCILLTIFHKKFCHACSRLNIKEEKKNTNSAISTVEHIKQFNTSTITQFI